MKGTFFSFRTDAGAAVAANKILIKDHSLRRLVLLHKEKPCPSWGRARMDNPCCQVPLDIVVRSLPHQAGEKVSLGWRHPQEEFNGTNI